ncbi:hypothetical protein MMC08_007927, partial [Hypocenomyce scalaris]|nr:hypothetical protein [Hypocenomyce scalaris]
MTSSGYTLESVYADALKQVRDLRGAGRLSSAHYDTITGTSTPKDVLASVNDAILRHGDAKSTTKTRMQNMGESLRPRLERFGTAIDMLAQSSPQVMGVNLVGLLWGTLKFFVVVAGDIADTFNTVLIFFEDIVKGLPALETYIDIFGSSQLQLLRESLVDIYREFVVFGLQAVKLFDRSPVPTLGRSTWRSLESDFKSSISRVEKAGREVERIAA